MMEEFNEQPSSSLKNVEPEALPRLSFKFTKQTKSAVIQNGAHMPSQESEDHSKFQEVTHIENGLINGQLPAKKQLPVIPRIIRDKDWRIESLQRAVNEGTASDEQKALLALLLEGPGQFQTASTSTNSTIEIRPQGFGDEEEPLDVEPNYDAISYADFGAAFLRGRGWKKEEGIGRTNKQVVPLTVHSKPKSFKMPKAEDSDKSKDSDSKRDDRISKDSKRDDRTSKDSKRDDRASARREPKYELKRGSKQDTRQEEDDGIQFLGTIQKGQPWPSPNLLVRIISKRYKHGDYYKEKMLVVDAPSRDHIELKDDRGRVHTLDVEDLETVIPRGIGGQVCIVKGSRKNKYGIIVDRDDKRYQLKVRLIGLNDVVDVDFDDACEYRGNLEEMDYD